MIRQTLTSSVSQTVHHFLVVLIFKYQFSFNYQKFLHFKTKIPQQSWICSVSDVLVNHRNILQHLSQSSKANSSLSINYFDKAQRRGETDNIYSEVPWGGSMYTWMHTGFEEKLMHRKIILQFNIPYYILLPTNLSLQNISYRSLSPTRLKRNEYRICINSLLPYIYSSQEVNSLVSQYCYMYTWEWAYVCALVNSPSITVQKYSVIKAEIQCNHMFVAELMCGRVDG